MNIRRKIFCAFISFGAFGSLNTAMAEPWTLERVVQYARNNGPEIEIAKARVRISQAQLGEVASIYWPHLQIQSGYTRTNSPLYSFGNILNQRTFSQDIDFNDVPTTDNFVARGVVTYPLYSGGRISAQREVAEAGLLGSRFNREVVESDFSTQAAINFLELKRVRELIHSLESAIENFRSSEKAVAGRLDSGSALRTELLDIQVQLENAKEELVRAKNAEKLAQYALISLLAVDEIEFQPDFREIEIQQPSSLQGVTNRAELKLLETQVAAAEAQVRAARSGYLPKVSLQGGYEYNKGWESGGDGTNYTFGVVGEWEIWDGQRTINQEEGAKAHLSILSSSEDRLRRDLELQRSQSIIKLEEASESLEIAEKTVRLARESAELSRLRFSQGLTNSTQLIDSEHALTAAAVRYSQAKIDKCVATILLRRALGLAAVDLNEEIE